MTTADAGLHAIGTGRRLPALLASRVQPVHPAQLTVWLLAVVLTPITGSQVVLACAVLLIGVTSVRVAGDHLIGWTLIWVRYRLLRYADRRLDHDPLLVLAPDLRLREHLDRAGNAFGVVGVDDGWTAVLRLTPRGEPDHFTTLTAVLREACENADIPLSGAQLAARIEDGQRVFLLAVRYRPAEAPLAALSRGEGELGQHRATVRAALGVLGTLAGLGWTGRVLEAGELAAELRDTLGVQGELLAGSRRTSVVVDAWRSWSAGGTTQTSFLSRAGLESAFAVSARNAAFTVVSYNLRRTSLGRLHEEILIRLVTHRGTRKPPGADDLDVPVVPLYGRHETAVRRTLPLALPA